MKKIIIIVAFVLLLSPVVSHGASNPTVLTVQFRNYVPSAKSTETTNARSTRLSSREQRQIDELYKEIARLLAILETLKNR